MMGFQHLFSSWSFVCEKQVQQKLRDSSVGEHLMAKTQIQVYGYFSHITMGALALDDLSFSPWNFPWESLVREADLSKWFKEMTSELWNFSGIILLKPAGSILPLILHQRCRMHKREGILAPWCAGLPLLQGASYAWHNRLQDTLSHYWNIKYNGHYNIWLFIHRALGMTEFEKRKPQVLLTSRLVLMKWRNNELLRIPWATGRQNIPPDVLTFIGL